MSNYLIGSSSIPTNSGTHSAKGSSHKNRPARLAFGEAAFSPPPPAYMLPPIVSPLGQDFIAPPFVKPNFGPPDAPPLIISSSGPPPVQAPQQQGGFMSQVFSFKGLLYSALLLTGATALGHHFGGKAAQVELKALKQKAAALGTELASSKASAKSAEEKLAAQVESSKPVLPAPKETREIAVQTDLPAKSALKKPAAKGEGIQKEPKPKVRFSEPDWTNMYHQYDDTHGQLSWQIKRLYQRQSSLPKPLNMKAVDLMNTTQRYGMTYTGAEADRDLIGKVSEMGLAANKNKGEMLKSKEVAELRARIPAMQHFIQHSRNTLQEFETYQQQNGSGLRWLTQGIARYDRNILKEIEQKLNAYESTVQALCQAIQFKPKR